MFQLKREEALRNTLVELAKQVSFPDWNVMHGVESHQSKIPILFKGSKDASKSICNNVINIEYTSEDTGQKISGPQNDVTPEISFLITPCEIVQGNVVNSGDESVPDAAKYHNNEVNNVIRRSSNSEEKDKISLKNGTDDHHKSQENLKHSQIHSTVTDTQDLTTTGSHRISLISTDSLLTQRPEQLTRTRSDSDMLRKSTVDSELFNNSLKAEEDFKERRFRKKSMSFAGALPIRIEVTADDNGAMPTILSSSRLPNRNTKEVSFSLGSSNQSSINEGKIPRSPRRTRKTIEKKANDPSHYLGRRRGSYNPSYEQTQVIPVVKTKERYQRARSLFVGKTVADDEFRQTLASRLMKVASPALRETFSEETEEYDQQKEDEENVNKQISNKVEPSSDSIPEETNSQNSTTKNISLNEENNRNGKSARVLMKRRPWETSSDIISPQRSFPSPLDNDLAKKNSTYFSVASNKRAYENGHVNYSGNPAMISSQSVNNSVQNEANENRAKDQRRKFRTEKSSSNPERGTLIERYQRQSRSMSCFGSLQPSMHATSQSYRGYSTNDAESSSGSSSDEENKESISIHSAAKSGKLRRLKKIVEDGMDVNIVDENNWPAIHYALLGGHFSCVAYLLTKGADIRHYSKGRTLKYFK